MNDEILTGYSLASFLSSEKCRKWSPDTRHCYANCLQGLLAFVQRHGPLTPELLADWRNQLSESYGRTTLMYISRRPTTISGGASGTT